MEHLLKTIRKCEICKGQLPFSPNPVLAASHQSKIVIIGHAPGKAVHHSGAPWDDQIGERLRTWLGVTAEHFYQTNNFAIIPMGFCYPGRGKTGDLPPRKECAPEWHPQIFSKLTDVKMTLLIVKYAQSYYLQEKLKKNLTETVRQYVDFQPDFFPLPHPSPRNNIWLKKNPWFEEEVVPALKLRIKGILTDSPM